MEYNLIAICECKINAEDEREAIFKLLRGIEDFVVEEGKVHYLNVRKTGAGIVIGDR